MQDKQMQPLLPGPELLVFDIDDTLIVPNMYKDLTSIKAALFDPSLLTSLLDNPKYQIALASYNSDISPGYIGGKRLGRAILDLQHSHGNSKTSVEDDFIEAWIFPNFGDISKYRKNFHIHKIILAYKKKYNKSPPIVHFYDDQIENVYHANRFGINGYWCSSGLTNQNINKCMQITKCIQFHTMTTIDTCLSEFSHLLRSMPTTNTIVYSLYLPKNNDYANSIYNTIMEKLSVCGIHINVISSAF